ncbi:MAG: DsrE/DsrF/DrsH-like family protein [Promethearchaeota archaeon]
MPRTTIVVASGDMDKLYSSLIVGTGALSMGSDVSLYFTFFGLQRLKKGGLEKGGLSRMNFFGLGKWMMKRQMRKANVRPLKDLMADFKELGGKVIACDMTMKVMGISEKELDDSLVDEYGAVGTYLNDALKSEVTLFI